MPTLRFRRVVPNGLDSIDYARAADQMIVQIARAMRWDGDEPPEVNVKIDPYAASDPNIAMTAWVEWPTDLELVNPLAEGDDPAPHLRVPVPPKEG